MKHNNLFYLALFLEFAWTTRCIVSIPSGLRLQIERRDTSRKKPLVCRIVTSEAEYDSIDSNNNIFARNKSIENELSTVLAPESTSKSYFCQPISSDLVYKIEDRVVSLSTNVLLDDIIQYQGVKLNETTATVVVDEEKTFKFKVLPKTTKQNIWAHQKMEEKREIGMEKFNRTAQEWTRFSIRRIP
jgi:hypothetical protein